MERALTFGAVAEAYERYRPGYPDALVEEVLAYAARPVRTALEIGAGTGKATRAFVGRGVHVTATDPDPAMLAELRRHVTGPVTTVRAALEDLTGGGAYDLVLAAASLHWTEAEGRWPRIAGLLAFGGVFASFGGHRELADPQVLERVARVRSRFLETDEAVPSPDGTPPGAALAWPATELVATPLFTDVRQVRLPVHETLSADAYAGHLSTVSAYLQLPAPQRRRALVAIRAALPEEVHVTGDVTLHLARTVGEGSR